MFRDCLGRTRNRVQVEESRIKKNSERIEIKQEKNEQYFNISKKSSEINEKNYIPRKYEKGVPETNVHELKCTNISNQNKEKITPIENIPIKQNKEKEKKPCVETERANIILETVEKLNEDSEKNVEKKEKKINSDINNQAFINKIEKLKKLNNNINKLYCFKEGVYCDIKDQYTKSKNKIL